MASPEIIYDDASFGDLDCMLRNFKRNLRSRHKLLSASFIQAPLLSWVGASATHKYGLMISIEL